MHGVLRITGISVSVVTNTGNNILYIVLIERGCACLAQLPCTMETEQERPRRIADIHVKC
jgi:hypothetical protein